MEDCMLFGMTSQSLILRQIGGALPQCIMATRTIQGIVGLLGFCIHAMVA
jgi:hypothetical protein